MKEIKMLNTSEPMNDLADDELSLHDPYSKITCFILHLYSFEFGNPPLYAELNRACRDKDMSMLEHFGPFARALGEITIVGESNRDDQDQLENG